jgi:hypothetical protein
VIVTRQTIPWRWLAVLVAFQAMALLTAGALMGWRV